MTLIRSQASNGRNGATAKYSIYIAEVRWTLTNEAERNKALLNNRDYSVAEHKCVSVLYLSLAVAARKTSRLTNTFERFTDK